MANNGDILTWNTALAVPLQYEWQPPGLSVYAPTIFRPVGGTMIDVAAATVTGTGYATTEVDEECRAWYVGRCLRGFTSAKVGVDILTAVVAPTWCEIALLKGTPVLWAGACDLTLIAYADTSATWTVPGPQTSTLTGTITAGDHLWIAHSCKVSGGPDPLPSFRAVLPDYIMSGVHVYASGTRPSTMASPTSFNRCGAAVRGVDFLAGCS